mmetsp:Transcript_11492/g.18760  ORF Transcript_11492/g.18760 Transcript_11492/m.18760 type:complete len:186 (+) Transcript_11492:89-646(+)|eukprot:CAMPEP_0114431842 /NCGR_PEP_ID=MMETSP0103-20121206/10827_1 /TAXON_ID=37642 ORGANISM="Paraphysomonas imperforata, Strain PA2" /NCGR_SAMPLE_ID=MMETSP0103 /ASSEMBLY_ACC=CAM_ASM_000201 /LENGTH=185 /DNA_ID=CAMNT_0001601457 /DNA_START=82 /DNA_END=639 /DNA_ORIENTATION=+
MFTEKKVSRSSCFVASASFKSHLLMWLVCFAIFMTSCSSFSFHPAFFPFSRRRHQGGRMANAATMDVRGRATAEQPHQQNDTTHNNLEPDEKKEEVHINMQRAAPEKKDDTTSSEEKSSSSRRGRTRGGNPELRMSDRERKKREEMDHSSDPLIVSLTAEQSEMEHVNLMKHLRELQKQEIVIEV